MKLWNKLPHSAPSLIVGLAVSACVLAFDPVPARAQVLHCPTVEAFGNGLAPQILQEMNGNSAGQSMRINRRKTLYIVRVHSIAFRGCRMTVTADVILRRRFRRDARGPVILSGNVRSFSLTRRQVCLNDLRVDSLRLSNTLRIGENFYRWIARIVLRRGQCFSGRR